MSYSKTGELPLDTLSVGAGRCHICHQRPSAVCVQSLPTHQTTHVLQLATPHDMNSYTRCLICSLCRPPTLPPVWGVIQERVTAIGTHTHTHTLAESSITCTSPLPQFMFALHLTVNVCSFSLQAPDVATFVEVEFEKGNPVAIDGVKMSPATLLTKLNEMGGKNGIGRVDLVESRFVGMKSRGESVGQYHVKKVQILFQIDRAFPILFLQFLIKRFRTVSGMKARSLGAAQAPSLACSSRSGSGWYDPTPYKLPPFPQGTCCDIEWSLAFTGSQRAPVANMYDTS